METGEMSGSEIVSSSFSMWLTVAEAASRARCHEETIRRAYHAGQLHRHGFGARGVRILLGDLDDWLRRGAKTS